MITALIPAFLMFVLVSGITVMVTLCNEDNDNEMFEIEDQTSRLKFDINHFEQTAFTQWCTANNIRVGDKQYSRKYFKKHILSKYY